MKNLKPTNKLKELFQELVTITTSENKRRDWSLLRWKNEPIFNLFKLKDLMSK